MDTGTATPLGKPKEPGMGDVPAAIEKLNVSVCDRNLMPSDQFFERPQDGFGQVSVK
jgi:hypothetical protein